jgi:membrane protein
MAALNIVYDEEEERGFVGLTLVSLAFTLGGIVLAAVLVAVVAAAPAALSGLGLGGAAATAVGILRWPVLLLVLIGAIGIVFRYGPSRSRPRWRWIVWGVVATAVLWILVSALFSFYLANFASYSATYGALGAVIGLMMWLYLSTTILLAGAALNSEIERQVATDTTTGPAEPLGRRGAVMADRLP